MTNYFFQTYPYGSDKLEFDVRLPIVLAGSNRSFDGDVVAQWNFQFDPKISRHSLRTDFFRDFYDHILEAPIDLLYDGIDEEYHPAVSIPLGLISFSLGQYLAVIEHENGHFACALESGAQNVNLVYRFSGRKENEAIAGVSIPKEEKEKLTADRQLLIGGAGLSAVLESSRSRVEGALLNGNHMDIVDAMFLTSNFIGHIMGFDSDYAKNHMVLNPNGNPKDADSSSIMVVNVTRPINLFLSGYIFAIGPKVILPPIILDWSATFGPLGDQYTGRVYARLDEKHVIEPFFRFTHGDRPSGSVGFAWFMTGNTGDYKHKLYVEGGYQPHFGGPVVAGGTMFAFPLLGGIELNLDIYAQSRGFFPDSSTFDPTINAALSLRISTYR